MAEHYLNLPSDRPYKYARIESDKIQQLKHQFSTTPLPKSVRWLSDDEVFAPTWKSPSITVAEPNPLYRHLTTQREFSNLSFNSFSNIDNIDRNFSYSQGHKIFSEEITNEERKPSKLERIVSLDGRWVICLEAITFNKNNKQPWRYIPNRVRKFIGFTVYYCYKSTLEQPWLGNDSL